MSDTPVLELTTEDPLDFSIGDPDDVAFSFDQADTLDADLGNPEIVVNTDHSILINRDASGQHPISAITGLNSALSVINYDIAQAELGIDSLERRKQDKLVSGVNIKTVREESLLGSGNVDTDPDSISLLEIYDVVNS